MQGVRRSHEGIGLQGVHQLAIQLRQRPSGVHIRLFQGRGSQPIEAPDRQEVSVPLLSDPHRSFRNLVNVVQARLASVSSELIRNCWRHAVGNLF